MSGSGNHQCSTKPWKGSPRAGYHRTSADRRLLLDVEGRNELQPTTRSNVDDERTTVVCDCQFSLSTPLTNESLPSTIATSGFPCHCSLCSLSSSWRVGYAVVPIEWFINLPPQDPLLMILCTPPLSSLLLPNFPLFVCYICSDI